MPQKYDVTLANPEDGDLVTVNVSASDDGQAADLALEQYPSYSIQDLEPVGPKYPEVEVELGHDDGNSFMLISKTRSALRQNLESKDRVEEFTQDAMSSKYSEVLLTVNEWVTVK
jgi:hypothetical protein